MVEEPVEYKDACISFIDIQGFKDLVVTQHSDNPQAVYEILKVFKKAQYMSTDDFYFKYEPEIVNFSDSIVRGALLAEQNQEADVEIVNEIRSVRLMQQELLKHISGNSQGFRLEDAGVFIRGGMTSGKTVIIPEENIVFGPTMIKAVDLEEIEGSSFRIVLDEEMIASYPATMAMLERDKIIARDEGSKISDGLWFINYWSVNKNRRYGFFVEYERLEKVKTLLQAKLTLYSGVEKLYLKYLWAAEKHNAAILEETIFHMAIEEADLTLDRLIVRLDT